MNSYYFANCCICTKSCGHTGSIAHNYCQYHEPRTTISSANSYPKRSEFELEVIQLLWSIVTLLQKKDE